MENAITIVHLHAIVDRINRAQGQPILAWAAKPDSSGFSAVPGVYHLDAANGGFSLLRMVNPAGGCTSPLGTGSISKPALRSVMLAYLAGLQDSGK